LKIAVEGKRYLNTEKRDVFVRFAANRPTRSARPDQRPSPSVTNPLSHFVPTHTQYDEPIPLQPGYNARPEPAVPAVSSRQEEGYGRADTGFRREPPNYYMNNNAANLEMTGRSISESPQQQYQQYRRGSSQPAGPDARFSGGTTTQTAYRQPVQEAFTRQV
jgi:hypothetical protein